MIAAKRWHPTHYYVIKRWGSPRFGQACNVIARGRNGNLLIEFADGERLITCRFGVRRLPL